MTDTTDNGSVQLAFDATHGVATLTLAMPKVNKISDDFGHGLSQALDWAQARDGLRGIIIASAHKDWCVGADIDRLYKERDAAELLARVKDLGALYRRLETLGVPVVAALTGSALGGGCELALACHHRIAVNDPRIQIGLPEVTLGVIPGAGGTQRLPRVIGIQGALDIILQGKMLRAPKAKAAGLVDALAPSAEALRDAAVTWIEAHPGAKQPWDAGTRIPGPQPSSGDARNMFMAACGMLTKKTAGCYPAPQLAVSAMQEGLAVSFDRGLDIEARYFVKLAVSDQAKDMLRTLWFHRTAAEKHEGLPSTTQLDMQKVGILGAGMMGAGLAFISAKAGFHVVLKDIKPDVLEAAEAHCTAQAAKLRHLGEDDRAALLSRITYTVDAEPLQHSDLIIEAVFENLDLKHAVTTELEPLLGKGGVWASNTSALPIDDLASVAKNKAAFIGMHFFSPVEKMQLVEIITGAATSDETTARALAFTRKLGKLPIVVGDGYGFFTTRVFSAYILEGAQMVAEGYDPVLVEWAGRSSGMVVPPLQVFDEVTLSLGAKGFEMGRRYGKTLDIAGVKLVETMVDQGRAGRSAGAGFYNYVEGRRRGLWKEVATLAAAPPESGTPEDVTALLASRLLGLQALEAARAVEDGVIKQNRDAEVGAIFGIGFAPNTGGPLAYIDRMGLASFVTQMDDFTARFGPRFEPPALLRRMAAKGERFFEAV